LPTTRKLLGSSNSSTAGVQVIYTVPAGYTTAVLDFIAEMLGASAMDVGIGIQLGGVTYSLAEATSLGPGQFIHFTGHQFMEPGAELYVYRSAGRLVRALASGYEISP